VQGGLKKNKRTVGSKKVFNFLSFFTMLKNEYIAIENPIGIMSSLYRKPDQTNTALAVWTWRNKSDVFMVKRFA